jgi:hypothetical protein
MSVAVYSHASKVAILEIAFVFEIPHISIQRSNKILTNNIVIIEFKG